MALYPSFRAAWSRVGAAGRDISVDPRCADCRGGDAGAAVPGQYSAGGGDDVSFQSGDDTAVPDGVRLCGQLVPGPQRGCIGFHGAGG